MAKGPALFGVVRMERLAASLRTVTTRLPSEIRKADMTLAADIAARAHAKAIGLGSVHKHVAPGIVARGPTVGLDAASQPAILGAEFGGGARPRTRQFPPFRGSGPGAGYMLFPTIRELDVVERYGEILDALPGIERS